MTTQASAISCVFVETQTPYKVCGQASHGSEAIQRAKELQPNLVLIDLSMPVLSGAEAASVIKNVMPNTKIILFSMHMNDVPKALAAKIGVDLTLSKMDGITRLGQHLKALLAPIDSVEAPKIETSNLETPIKNKPV